MHILDQLIHLTVRIETIRSDGQRATGTGFICNFTQREDGKHVPAIVTNKHVVEGGVIGVFHMTLADEAGNPKYGDHIQVPVANFEATCVMHPDPNVDLAVLPFAGVLDWLQAQGKRPFYRAAHPELFADAAFVQELSAVEDIIMIGYPNGLWDRKNNLPIVRRGITATPPYVDFEGLPQFMIDCACFNGSSGSPVFLFNLGAYAQKKGGIAIGGRYKLLGVLWGGPVHTAAGEVSVVPVPTAVRAVAQTGIPNNLGYCVKAEQLLAFENHFAELLDAQAKAKDAAQEAVAAEAQGPAS